MSCAPGALTLDGQNATCDSAGEQFVGEANGGAANWGRGRPRIVNVTSQSLVPNKLLAAGDLVVVTFDADVDVAATLGSGVSPLSGSALVTSLFALPASLGSDLEGSWVDSRTFAISLLAPPTEALLSGSDYSVACQPGAPATAALPARISPTRRATRLCGALRAPRCAQTRCAAFRAPCTSRWSPTCADHPTTPPP